MRVCVCECECVKCVCEVCVCLCVRVYVRQFCAVISIVISRKQKRRSQHGKRYQMDNFGLAKTITHMYIHRVYSVFGKGVTIHTVICVHMCI